MKEQTEHNQAQITSQKVHCEETFLSVLLLKGEELKRQSPERKILMEN